MTVSTTQNRITYNGDALTLVFSFPYKFIETSDLVVYVDEVLLVESVDYSVGTPSDSGANITLMSAPGVGVANVIIYRDPDFFQSTDLPTNGRFPADSVERMVDKVTLVVQRLKDLIDRSVRLSDADSSTAVTFTLPIDRANKAMVFDADGNITASADIYEDQAQNAASSAADAAASALVALNAYEDLIENYFGALASDPGVNPIGGDLAAGDLYFNTASGVFRVYTGSVWQNALPAPTAASFTVDIFSGTGAQTAFGLSVTPGSLQSIQVMVAGVVLRPTLDYTLSTATVTFASAPANASNNIQIRTASEISTGTPADGSVTTAKLAAGLLDAYLLKAGGTVTGDLTMSGASIIEAEGAAVTAASSTNIWATDGNTRHVTGNTTINDFSTAPQAGARMKLIFDGTPTLTQGANLNLNGGGSNVVIEAGDWAEVYADTTTQFDVVVHRKSGQPVVTSGGSGLRLLKYTVITATNASWAKQAGTTAIEVLCVGGGGAGRDVSGGFGAEEIGEGGQAGCQVRGYLDTGLTSTFVATIGAASSGNGNTTSFTTSTPTTIASAAGGLAGTMVIMPELVASIQGGVGQSCIGRGGAGGSNAAGSAAAANSGAGGGGASGASTYNGGNGGSGIIYVWEYG